MLTVESIDLSNLPTFMVSPQQGYFVRMPNKDFVRHVFTIINYLNFSTNNNVSVSRLKYPLSTKSPCLSEVKYNHKLNLELP